MPVNSHLGSAPFGPIPVSTGTGGGGGGGTNQKQPQTYTVGLDAGAPTAGAATWTLAAFAGSYVVLTRNNIGVPLRDQGTGASYITKVLASTQITLVNDVWLAGDVLTYTLITPTP